MLVIKGIIVGIGKIIPGVSGSMIAISLGIYQELIDSINNIFKYEKKSIKFLFKVAIGIVISIALFSKIILYSLEKWYITTMFFFIGLIIGGFDNIKKETNKKDTKFSILSFVLITILGVVNINNEIRIYSGIVLFVYFIFIGFIDAMTTVIPGISGTATLMMLGSYNMLIKSFSTVFDFYYLESNVKVLVPFFIGFVFGIIITTKIIQYLFKNYKSKTYSVIMGFSISTVFLMLLKCFDSAYTIIDLIMSFILLILGFLLTKKINRLFTID